jgi:hypothetical protein
VTPNRCRRRIRSHDSSTLCVEATRTLRCAYIQASMEPTGPSRTPTTIRRLRNHAYARDLRAMSSAAACQSAGQAGAPGGRGVERPADGVAESADQRLNPVRWAGSARRVGKGSASRTNPSTSPPGSRTPSRESSKSSRFRFGSPSAADVEPGLRGPRPDARRVDDARAAAVSSVVPIT